MSCIGLPADEMPGANNGREGESAVPLADAHATFESSMTSRFLADAMLGGLVRWLRALGFDTAYDPAIHDPELVALADAQARMLLTRDRHLLIDLRPAQALLITDDAPVDRFFDGNPYARAASRSHHRLQSRATGGAIYALPGVQCTAASRHRKRNRQPCAGRGAITTWPGTSLFRL